MGRLTAIESPSNPLVRDILRSLEEHTCFLLEGEKPILEAVSAGLGLEHVLHDASVRPGRLAAATASRPRLVSRAVLERIADTKTPQHLIAIAKRRDVPVAELFARPGPLVFLFGLQDPGNLGAVVRVAEAGGAAAVIATGGSADPFGWKALRGSMGSALRLPIISGIDTADALADLRRRGYRSVATTPRGGRSIFEADLSGTTAIVIGGEGAGLDQVVVDAADERVTIPMEPPVESLNTAVTAAIIIYEARRQRMQAGGRHTAGRRN